jgi:hypothetical protein
MLITAHIIESNARATSVATTLPCWHRFGPKRQLGDVPALAGRCAR